MWVGLSSAVHSPVSTLKLLDVLFAEPMVLRWRLAVVTGFFGRQAPFDAIITLLAIHAGGTTKRQFDRIFGADSYEWWLMVLSIVTDSIVRSFKASASQSQGREATEAGAPAQRVEQFLSQRGDVVASTCSRRRNPRQQARPSRGGRRRTVRSDDLGPHRAIARRC